MRYRDLINEGNDDAQHKRDLEQTGFWGKQGAGILFVSKKQKTILFNYRSRHVEQPGTWGVWGGAIDSRENPVDAAIREASEESGQNVSKSQIVPAYVFHDKTSGFKYHNFFAVFDSEFTLNIPSEHAWETQGWGWFGLDDLPSPLQFGAKALLQDHNSRMILKHIFQI